MKITKYAQSTISVEHGARTLLVDPGSYNFEPGRLSMDDLPSTDVLVITHHHADHFDPLAIKAICSRSTPLILTTEDVRTELKSAGIESRVLKCGQVVEHAGFVVTGTRADHIVKGEVIDTFGVVVEVDGKKVYHTSDTLYLDDKPVGVSVVLVPINNRGVAMSAEDAARFVRELRPQIAIPVHYDSPKDAHIDPHSFQDLLSADECEVVILGFGEGLEVA